MRYLGLDVGDRRIGVALSDITGLIANPIGNIERTGYSFEKDVDMTVAKIKELGAEAVVVGLPKNMNGTLGPRAEAVTAFAEAVKAKLDIPFHFWDERLTTVEAHRIMIDAGMRRDKRKTKVDRVAAVIILQGFLDFSRR